ncbi:MAG: MaoC family dehydratase [Desulfocapsaceae bacterium]|nr:MaoC family dehydratase [Desulfocapsaceae bacterium]
MHLNSGKAYNEITIGDAFGATMTVTESHLVLGAGLFGDFNPLHVNEEFSRNSRFGSRILHGPISGAMVSASIGNFFGEAAIAYLEHNCRFIGPIRIGDTITTCWTITDKIDKPKLDGGIAVLEAKCSNQKGEEVLTATGKMLLSNSTAHSLNKRAS